MQKLDFDLSQRREEEEEDIPTESEKRPSFPRSGKGNPYHVDVDSDGDSDGDSDYDDIYAPPSSSSASSSENSDEEPYVRDTSIITLTTP